MIDSDYPGEMAHQELRDGSPKTMGRQQDPSDVSRRSENFTRGFMKRLVWTYKMAYQNRDDQ